MRRPIGALECVRVISLALLLAVLLGCQSAEPMRPLKAEARATQTMLLLTNPTPDHWEYIDIVIRTEAQGTPYRLHIDRIDGTATRPLILNDFTDRSGNRFAPDRLKLRYVDIEASTNGFRHATTLTLK